MPTLKLPVSLSDADRLVVSADLTQIIYARELEEAAKKEATKEFSGRIKAHRAQEHSLNESLRTGTIEREIEVEDRADYARGVIETFRLDVDPPVVVKVRQIDPDERQLKLTGDVKETASKDGPPTEEQELAGSPEEAEEMREKRLAREQAERARGERLGAWLEAITPSIVVLPRLDAKEDDDGFEAKIGSVNGFAWQMLAATGQTVEEARDAVREQLIEQWKLAEEKAEHARKDRIMAKLGEMLPRVTFTPHDGTGVVVAAVETETWRMEAEGDDHELAARYLREKLLAKFEAEEDEIAKLAAEQLHDRAKDGPRHKLKAPGGKKGKRISVKTQDKAGKETDVTDEVFGEGEGQAPDDTVDPGAGDEGRAF